MSLLGSLRTKIYRDLRLETLPPISWSSGLNQSSPLGINGSQTVGSDQTTFRRLRALDNCQRSGPFRVTARPPNPETKHDYQFAFRLFATVYSIPLKTGKEWKLIEDPVVNVQWDVSEKPHAHAFAIEAEATDDASRLGIRVFTEINSK